MDIDVRSKTEQRKFGLLMAIVIAALGSYRWWRHDQAPVALFSVAATFLVLGLAAPVVLRPVLAAWLKLAEALNWVMTRVTLTLAYLLVLTPMGVLARLFKGDLLDRAWKPDAETYWEEAEEQPDALQRYLNQF